MILVILELRKDKPGKLNLGLVKTFTKYKILAPTTEININYHNYQKLPRPPQVFVVREP